MKKPTNLMLRLTTSDIKGMMEYAIDNGYKIRRRWIRYDQNGMMVYNYLATLVGVRFAISKGYRMEDVNKIARILDCKVEEINLQSGQTLRSIIKKRRKPDQNVGITHTVMLVKY
jgi:hypothetical protein